MRSFDLYCGQKLCHSLAETVHIACAFDELTSTIARLSSSLETPPLLDNDDNEWSLSARHLVEHFGYDGSPIQNELSRFR